MKTRSESEMYDLIFGFALHDERIRGILLNGSRVNPNEEKDIFQDYDIVYLVTDVEPFKEEEYILSHFGDIMILQKPEDKINPPPIGDGRYTYLMQFTDGNRIDMHVMNISRVHELLQDSLTKVLLDKDNVIPKVEPSENSYLVEKPSEKAYQDCCNDFIFGIGSHIPKTIWRQELPLLKILIENVLREPLVQMFKWSIGIQTHYQSSIGKGGKYLEKYLDQETWDDYKKTYADENYDNIWESLFILHKLFLQSARHVGESYGYNFPEEENSKSLNFLKHVKDLPHDVDSIF